jgi:beta-glucosidase
VASISRPVLELKGLAKIALAPAEEGTARFTLAAEDLAFPGPDLALRLEPGTIELLVGRTAERGTALATSLRLLVP